MCGDVFQEIIINTIIMTIDMNKIFNFLQKRLIVNCTDGNIIYDVQIRNKFVFYQFLYNLKQVRYYVVTMYKTNSFVFTILLERTLKLYFI